MKKLQNDFTTPKQSRKLLQLGVPADSANMLWFGNSLILMKKPLAHYQLLYRQINAVNILPCWSTGRLIEIFEICNLYELHKFSTRNWLVNIKILMKDYEGAAKEKKLDFSKLED